MDMRVQTELLVPSVQHAEETIASAENYCQFNRENRVLLV